MFYPSPQSFGRALHPFYRGENQTFDTTLPEAINTLHLSHNGHCFIIDSVLPLILGELLQFASLQQVLNQSENNVTTQRIVLDECLVFQTASHQLG